MRKPFSDYLWLWLIKSAGVVYKTLTWFFRARFFVSRRTFRGLFSREHHHVSVTFGIWIKSLVFSRQLFQRLSNVHPTGFPWQVDLFEVSLFFETFNFVGFLWVYLIFNGPPLNIFQQSWKKNNIPYVWKIIFGLNKLLNCFSFSDFEGKQFGL